MKVAFASPMRLERDGVASYSRELSRELAALCTLEHIPLDADPHGRDHFRRLAEAVNRCDVLHVEHAHAFFKRPLYPFREAFRFLLRQVKVPRLVVYHEPLEKISASYPPGGGTLLGRTKNAALFAAVVTARPAANRFWLPWYNREIYSLPERVVVHTEYRAEQVRSFAPDATVFVLPHPVYLPKGGDVGEPPGSPPPFPEESVVVTVFGFIDWRKDYIGVLSALLGMPERYGLLVAGGCHEESESTSPISPYGEMMAFIRANRLEERVRITGYCPDSLIPGIMEATDIVIAPFTQDHSSGSINMGIAYSRPVVAYRTKLTGEMNRNGAGLLLVEGRGDLPDMLRRLENDAPLRDKAISMGREYRDRYDFPAAARRFVRWYEEMLAAGRGTGKSR
jgi:glycosyltransferase involved in cell wall biosynthesis